MESETDPRRRQLLEQVRDHMRAEIRGELGPLLATLIDDPRYHLWGLGAEMGPKGRVAVETFYKDMIASGGNHFEFAIERIVVDADSVVTEGVFRSAVPGSLLAASGVAEVEGKPVDAEAEYLSENRILTVWPAEADGRLVGEDIYFGSPPFSALSRL